MFGVGAPVKLAFSVAVVCRNRGQEMKISVVVPAFNEERLLPGSLSSVRAAMEGFARLGWKSELIVCDNNSTDCTAEIAKGMGAQVVFEPINQIGRARNTGAACAGGDWIFFVDADSYPSVELFLEAADAIRAGCLAGGSTVAYQDAHPSVALVTGIWNAVSRINKWAAGRTASPGTTAGADELRRAGLRALFLRLSLRFQVRLGFPAGSGGRNIARDAAEQALAPLAVVESN